MVPHTIPFQNRPQGARGGATSGRGGQRGGQGGRGGGGRRNWDFKPQHLRDASVKVGPEWKVRDEYDFPRLNKLVYDPAGKVLPGDAANSVEDDVYGAALYYDKFTFDRITVKNPKPVTETDRAYPGTRVTASQDTIFQSMAKSTSTRTVFTTDTVLSTLMCATRSAFSWDIVVVKDGDKMWLDKRPGAAHDFVTVNENAPEPPPETSEVKENTASALAAEATQVQKDLLALVTKEVGSDKFTVADSNPYAEPTDGPLGSLLLRYRTFHLAGTDLAVRTTLDAAVHVPNSVANSSGVDPEFSAQSATDTVLVSVKALLEHDHRATEWKKRLDAHRGTVVATEIKNNGNRMAKWAVEAVLAGAGQIRIGFVSRTSPRSSKSHVLLSMMTFKPKEFAGQMNLSLNNAWGVVRTIIDRLWGYDDGKYVLVRDPNKPVIRIYEVPVSTFDDEFAEDLDDGDDGLDD
ncbi:eukaryotic translation initiation factor 3, subunit 7 [Gonapodya prolifera JEL478]|uniref:Eukaryotic translation initiation factor 3, subunit 7 n=1 Tax=Gonapodya prolifera (strain JEL478) TaxID=1344416 RepID=A0A139A7Z6_GONPJ|nr:eukaryotic translation initiation factor 3, subunit 7 [Gonapodya prolifera JEL478]|eukprot:KXS12565.1 eukaryotic translation initiation factor 3, subunit 7 [Gonapodya prolifera JEL478]